LEEEKLHQNNIKVKILCDNEALEGFKSGFGFSCLVEDKSVLFDIGGDLSTLIFNSRNLLIFS